MQAINVKSISVIEGMKSNKGSLYCQDWLGMEMYMGPMDHGYWTHLGYIYIKGDKNSVTGDRWHCR